MDSEFKTYRVKVIETKTTEYQVTAASEKEAKEEIRKNLDIVAGYGERYGDPRYKGMFARTKTEYIAEEL